jgi:hypothetical protein
VGTVSGSKNWNSSVVVNSASQSIISGCVEASQVPFQVGIAVGLTNCVGGINSWAGGVDLLAVVNARVTSADSFSVGGSVGAVNQTKTVRSLSVVQSAGKGVTSGITSWSSCYVNSAADLVAC